MRKADNGAAAQNKQIMWKREQKTGTNWFDEEENPVSASLCWLSAQLDGHINRYPLDSAGNLPLYKSITYDGESADGMRQGMFLWGK